MNKILLRMNKFITLNDFLTESKSSDNRYGCVMLYSEIPDWDKLIHRIVREEDLYDPSDEPGEYGYEEKPHITLLYGIHHDEILDESIIYKKIQEIHDFSVSVNEIGIFKGDETNDNPYDVVKFDIKPTKTLLKLRKEFETELPNTQTFPDFQPHMTISYVKRGEGKKYKRILKKPIRFKFTKGSYSDPDYKKSYFDLKSNEYKK